ncbi:MAG TPA: phosphoribosylformylglycinamidine synthase subunit PurQ [Spirochaetota bacterium]|nr:phosphoribosylformylglycinamidine synthase subunit PurQ [Spirochaetota bacterium]HOM39193.1 phosphoribosylformylglycinamidine synthase subunit PurQ [Spirochaetota bacterium]HPQ49228.1 phosphoribosylformylglycinamidine synthase subunit PurQ [Spirochaetota bacterium]
MKVGIVVFPGSNCDKDCIYAVKTVMKKDPVIIWHKDIPSDNVDFIIIPGGFSYGDYLRAGAIAKFSRIMDYIKEANERGKLILGICNGFQILTESGILPGALIKNNSTKFICKDVYIRVENNKTVFTSFYKDKDVIKIPIAHKEGNYYIDDNELAELIKNNQIVFRYSDESGNVNDKTNPNGSKYNIAGIINKKGNVLGMMPHPERSIESLLGSKDGQLIFISILNNEKINF